MTDLERRILLLAALSLPLASPAAAEEPPGHDMSAFPANWVKHEQIAMLLYPKFTAIDLVGPQYYFKGLMGSTVILVAKTMDPVTSDARPAPARPGADDQRRLACRLRPGCKRTGPTRRMPCATAKRAPSCCASPWRVTGRYCPLWWCKAAARPAWTRPRGPCCAARGCRPSRPTWPTHRQQSQCRYGTGWCDSKRRVPGASLGETEAFYGRVNAGLTNLDLRVRGYTQ